MSNYLANFGVDYPLMIFWAVNVDSVFNSGDKSKLETSSCPKYALPPCGSVWHY